MRVGNSIAVLLIELWALLPTTIYDEAVVIQPHAGPHECYCEIDGEVTYLETYDENFCISTQTQTVEAAGATLSGCIWYEDGLPGEEVIVEDYVPESPIVGSVARELRGLNQIRGISGQNTVQALSTVSGRIIFFFLSVVGTVGLAMFIYAGLLFMFSQGNS